MSHVYHKGNMFFLAIRGRSLFLGKTGKNKENYPFFMTHIKDPERHLIRKHQGYGMNYDLLQNLINADIESIIIPEDTKTQGFRGWIATVAQYLHGEALFDDEDEQRVVPLRELRQIPLNKVDTQNFLIH